MTTRDLDAVREFARSGPAGNALDQMSLEPSDWVAWMMAARRLEEKLDGAHDLDQRIHHLYLPVLFFALAGRRRTPSRPVFVGIRAPQGAGKTTLVHHLLELLPQFGLRGVGLSIDDFYLTRAEQLRVAAEHAGNPYLEHRGYPGTHDIDLGVRTLDALRTLNDRDIRIPRYDKSAHGGRGDRAPETEWPVVRGPLDLIFLDGWMLGFEPVPEDRLPPGLVAPNRALAHYTQWMDRLDAFVVLRALDRDYVLQWRVEAEENMKARGRPGLRRDEIEDYVRRFLPAYDLYGASTSPRLASRTLEFVLNERRTPVS